MKLVVSQLGGDERAQVVGWLHDVLEDSDLSSQDLVDRGISEDLVEVVSLLTKRREQTYRDYITGLKGADLAVKVKKADIVANLSDNPGNKQMIKLSKALIELCT